MAKTTFAELVATITGGETPRVWSLLVTVFGDVVAPGGGEISGVVLQRLMALCGVSPQAMRVALHRLRKDGWIESTKVGRVSRYRLSDYGGRETLAAAPRIYGAEQLAQEAWLFVGDPTRPLGQMEAVALGGALAISSTRDVERDDVLALPLVPPIPGWIGAAVATPDLEAQMALVRGRMRDLAEGLGGSDLDLLERTALRVLVVHGWRRIVLRVPVLPDFVFADTWAGPDARDAFGALMDRLSRPSVAALEGPN